jgi:undecaprenyl-diphosphatase
VTSFSALLLGLVQGLTEFLPISSSGHLVLAEWLLGIRSQDLAFIVFVHFGTMLATVTVFRAEVAGMLLAGGRFIARRTTWADPDLRLLIFIIIGTIPAALVGLLLEERIESIFSSPLTVGGMLLVTGLILWCTRYLRAGERAIGWRETIVVGCAQALAILPGISRSGTTISAALYGKVNKAKAVEFSFLLALPAILGATLLKAVDLLHRPPPAETYVPLILGTLAAYVSGYAAILFLLRAVRRGKLYLFSYYCWAVGLLAMLMFLRS